MADLDHDGYDDDTGLAVADFGGPAAPSGRLVYDAAGRAYWVTAENPQGEPVPRFDKAQAPQYEFDPKTGLLRDAAGFYYLPPEQGYVAPEGDEPSLGGGYFTRGEPQPAPPSLLAQFGIGVPPRQAGAGPTRPETYVDAQGTMHGIDPFTGREIFTLPGVGKAQTPDWQQIRDSRTGELKLFDPATGTVKVAGAFDYPSLSPEQQRAQAFEDAMLQRQWSQEDYERQRADSAAARREQQAYQSEQSAMDRAQRASEFAAQHGLDQQRARLEAANTVAARISDTSPAAMPAFLAAGGGNISNALAGGATALTPDAMLGAARGLRSIDEAQKAEEARREAAAAAARESWGKPQPARPGRMLPNGDYIDGNGQLFRWGITPGYGGIRPGNTSVTGVGEVTYVPGQGMVPVAQAAARAKAVGAFMGDPAAAPTSPAAVDYSDAAMSARIQASRDAGSGSGGDFGAPAFAYGTGGWVKAPPRFVVNDANPEGDEELIEVRDPEGNAKLRVHPAGGGRVPRFAFGTIADPLGTGLVTEADKPYIDRIRAIREGVDVKPPIAGGYFNTAFRRLAPSLQQRYFASLQDRYAVPEQDTRAEGNRYALRGAGRGVLSFGY